MGCVSITTVFDVSINRVPVTDLQVSVCTNHSSIACIHATQLITFLEIFIVIFPVHVFSVSVELSNRKKVADVNGMKSL